MKMVAVSFAVVSVLVSPFASADGAGPNEGMWRWSVSGGVERSANTAGQAAGTSSIADLGSLNPALAGDAGTVTMQERSLRNLFGTGWSAGAELSYGETSSLEGYGALAYSRQSGRRNVVVGQLTSPGLTTPANIVASFGELAGWSLDLGQRYYFLEGARARPYVGADVGLAHFNATRATYSAPDASVSFGEGRYFNRSNVLLGRLGAGVDVAVTPQVDLRVGADAEYRGRLTANATELTSTGLPSLGASAGHWLAPVHLDVAYHF
jgi:hypothetical protein